MDFGSRKYAFADGAPPVVIGEIGVNHNGDPALARRLVDVAVEAGVDIVKLQVFKSESEISRFAQLAPYQQVATSDATNQLDLCKALELTHSAIDDLRHYCSERKIGFFCSVFDSDSLRFLIDELKLATVKVASGEITNRPFLQEIGQRKVGVSVDWRLDAGRSGGSGKRADDIRLPRACSPSLRIELPCPG